MVSSCPIRFLLNLYCFTRGKLLESCVLMVEVVRYFVGFNRVMKEKPRRGHCLKIVPMVFSEEIRFDLKCPVQRRKIPSTSTSDSPTLSTRSYCMKFRWIPTTSLTRREHKFECRTTRRLFG